MTKLLIDDIDNVLSPLGGSGRVKYTCLDVSRRYMVLGANTGSLYFFERKSTSTIISKPMNQLQTPSIQSVIIPNTGIIISGNSFNNDNLSFAHILSLNDVRDQIQLIKINPTNDNILAVATPKCVFVIEPNISTRREKEKILFKVTDHPKESELTCMTWSPCGGYLFTGDDLGNVYCSSLQKGKRKLFFTAELVVKCDSRLVQLDILSIRPSLEVALTQIPHIAVALLISTLTRSLVITYQVNQTSNAGKTLGNFQIGKKLRENTKQGACFHKFYRNSLYASRPGKRLWLADRLDGRVLNTLNFSSEEGVPPIKPKPLCNESAPQASAPITGNHAMVFSKLLPYGNFVVSWDEKSLLLVDVNDVEVLEWKLELSHIFDICIHEGSIYILHGASRSISRVYSSLPLASNPVLDEDIVVHEQPQQPIEESKEDNNNNNVQQAILPSNSTSDITDYSNTETSTNDSNINTDTDNISLTNSTGSMNDISNQNEDTVTDSPKEQLPIPPINTTPTTTTTTALPPTPTPTTTTTTATLPPRSGSKANLFSDIQLSSEPLVALTSGGIPTPPQPRKTVIKKKVIKVPPTTNPAANNTNNVTTPSTTTTTTATTTTATTPLSKSQDLIEDKTNEPKRTVIIKKKIVKKPKPSEGSQDANTATTGTNNGITTTTTSATTVPQATGDTSNIGQGIFSTAVSSLQKINQFANKIQKQTSEISSDLTQKILGKHPHEVSNGLPTDPNGDQQPLTTPNTTPVSVVIEDTPLEILEKLTKKTHEALLEYKKTKGESIFLPILQIWINYFHDIEISTIGVNESISDIVTACFLLGINIVSNESSGQICKCWGEDIAKEFIQKYTQYLDGNKIISNCNFNGWYQCIDTLLEAELQVLSKQDSKVIATINQFVDSGNSTSAIAILEQHSSNYSMLFRYLKILISLDSLKAASFFSRHYPTITPHNVFVHMTGTNNANAKIEYLRHLVIDHQDCKYDSKLIMEWFTTCISISPLCNGSLELYRDDIVGYEKLPVLNSHQVEWKYRETMMTIIRNVIANEYFGSIENLERISRENGFWEGLLSVYLHCYESYSSKSLTFNQTISDSYAKKAIDLCIFTDNKQEFIRFFENNTKIEHWSLALKTMEYIRTIYEKDKQLEISELLVGKIMGRAIGPLQTIELISESKLFKSNDTKISPEVLSEWIRNGKWSLYNRSKLSYDILNGLDSHLWLKKPLTISPQILSLIGPEIDKSIPPHPFVNQNNHNHDHHLEGENDKFEFGIMPQFFEDNARRHWGIETELHSGVCLICTLPLTENPESSFLGSTPAIIVVFPNCGHAYHQVCIEEQGCLICFSKR